jgi:TorA maturation chaperone TorD
VRSSSLPDTPKNGDRINHQIAQPESDQLRAIRATEYLLLSNLFARAPKAELLARLTTIRGDATPLGMAHIALADGAAGASAEAAAKEYFDIFIGVGRGEIVPYASFYLTGFLNERPLARARADMDRLGIARSPDVFEPEDHISSLLEVMAGLLRGDFDAAPREADTFFARHIAPWAPRLMADIEAAPSARFYKNVAHFGRVWLDIEQEAATLSD